MRIEPCHKRVRAILAGEVVVDTVRPLLVWEIPYFPTYFFPAEDVRATLQPSGGDADTYDIKVTRATAPGAARRHHASPVEALRDTVRIDWRSMDEWLEEDEPVYTHPRDPHARIDILASSRRVRVVVAEVTVADSIRPHILFETGLPARHYLPLSDVRLDLLVPSTTSTSCPYKGTASYWSLEVGGRRYEDLAWIYRTPLPESQKIAGLSCFYAERVDLYVDEVLQDRPVSPFS